VPQSRSRNGVLKESDTYNGHTDGSQDTAVNRAGKAAPPSRAKVATRAGGGWWKDATAEIDVRLTVQRLTRER